MSWTHVEDKRPIARKEHQCFLCSKSIAKAERYARRFGFNDDGPDSFPMHELCERVSRDWQWWEWEERCEGEMEQEEIDDWVERHPNWREEEEANVRRQA